MSQKLTESKMQEYQSKACQKIGSTDSSHASVLGQNVAYPTSYNPDLLQALPRKESRVELGINPAKPPFIGLDLWTLFEVSWLNLAGVPQVAIAELEVCASSQYIIESKSLKLYLNSINQHKFQDWKEVEQLFEKDFTHCVRTPVQVRLYSLDAYQAKEAHGAQKQTQGILLDDLTPTDIQYDYQADRLALDKSKERVTESLYSHLLKSNCLITEQPDWASIFIHYEGQKICHTSLLAYIIGFRTHNEFHEPCVERIFMDIKQKLNPTRLTVQARYTRRGGIDINPVRSTEERYPRISRTVRQ